MSNDTPMPITRKNKILVTAARLDLYNAVAFPVKTADPGRDERALFEAEQIRQVQAYSNGRHMPHLERTGDGYQNPLVHAAWQGWQARAALAAPKTPAAPADLHGAEPILLSLPDDAERCADHILLAMQKDHPREEIDLDAAYRLALHVLAHRRAAAELASAHQAGAPVGEAEPLNSAYPAALHPDTARRLPLVHTPAEMDPAAHKAFEKLGVASWPAFLAGWRARGTHFSEADAARNAASAEYIRRLASAAQPPLQPVAPEFCCEANWREAKLLAWKERDLNCGCDHNESCLKCYPPAFREGGKFDRYAAPPPAGQPAEPMAKPGEGATRSARLKNLADYYACTHADGKSRQILFAEIDALCVALDSPPAGARPEERAAGQHKGWFGEPPSKALADAAIDRLAAQLEGQIELNISLAASVAESEARAVAAEAMPALAAPAQAEPVGVVMTRIKDNAPTKRPELYERFADLPNGTLLYSAPTQAHDQKTAQAVGYTNAPAQAMQSEARETLVNSLRASKGWMRGYAEAFVDDYVGQVPLSEEQIEAALNESVCQGEPVRFYLEAYAFEKDDEDTRRIMTREVIATAVRAALAVHRIGADRNELFSFAIKRAPDQGSAGCPNGCGLLLSYPAGQRCTACGFYWPIQLEKPAEEGS